MKYAGYVCLCALVAPSMSLAAESEAYMRLISKLDRPKDGYCLDVVGSGQHVRLDMPLTAHNCKGPKAYADEIVELRDDGTLYFPRYQSCVTAMGNNQTALAGNALMLKKCGEISPFLNGPRFQHYAMNDRQQIQLEHSDLCIVAGQQSSTTYSPEHRWRSLSMEPCSTADLSRSQWERHQVVVSHE